MTGRLNHCLCQSTLRSLHSRLSLDLQNYQRFPWPLRRSGSMPSFLPDGSPITILLLPLLTGHGGVKTGRSNVGSFRTFQVSGEGFPSLHHPDFVLLLVFWGMGTQVTQPSLYLSRNIQGISERCTMTQPPPPAHLPLPAVLAEGPWSSAVLEKQQAAQPSGAEAVWPASHCCLYSWSANLNTSSSYWKGKSLPTSPWKDPWTLRLITQSLRRDPGLCHQAALPSLLASRPWQRCPAALLPLAWWMACLLCSASPFPGLMFSSFWKHQNLTFSPSAV